MIHNYIPILIDIIYIHTYIHTYIYTHSGYAGPEAPTELVPKNPCAQIGFPLRVTIRVPYGLYRDPDFEP